MPKHNLFVICIFFWITLTASGGYGQTALTKHIDPNEKDPIEVTSDRMRSESSGEKIIFSGNVIGRWGDLEIISDVLEIYNSKDQNEAEEIIAIGNVIITRGSKKAKGDRAVYIDKVQKIIMTGSPKAVAWEGKNRIEGREMIFLLKTDRFVVNDRVRMKIFPKDNKKRPGNKKRSGPRRAAEISSKK